MFGFGSTNRDPFADIKSAERWFASFPDNDSLALHDARQLDSKRYSSPTAGLRECARY